MFGLFKSKGEKPEEKERKPLPEKQENRQFRELAAQFAPEELTILAVTGANGFGGEFIQLLRGPCPTHSGLPFPSIPYFPAFSPVHRRIPSFLLPQRLP